MEFHFTSKLEEYYQKFVELQEKLKRSEEQRFVLEMKFNDMVEVAKEEEQAHYRKLRAQYKRFLEEDKKRQDRNERIIRNLERIETRISMLSAKTERINILRRQYQNFLLRIAHPNRERQMPGAGVSRERSFIREEPLQEQQSALFRDDFSIPQKPKETLVLQKPLFEHPSVKKALDKDQSNEEKIEILDRYLQSISSQRCRDLINYEREARENLSLGRQPNTLLKDDSPSTNHATAIADDIMNSIYSRYYNKIDGLPKDTKLTAGIDEELIQKKSETNKKDNLSKTSVTFKDDVGIAETSVPNKSQEVEKPRILLNREHKNEEKQSGDPKIIPENIIVHKDDPSHHYSTENTTQLQVIGAEQNETPDIEPKNENKTITTPKIQEHYSTENTRQLQVVGAAQNETPDSEPKNENKTITTPQIQEHYSTEKAPQLQVVGAEQNETPDTEPKNENKTVTTPKIQEHERANLLAQNHSPTTTASYPQLQRTQGKGETYVTTNYPQQHNIDNQNYQPAMYAPNNQYNQQPYMDNQTVANQLQYINDNQPNVINNQEEYIHQYQYDQNAQPGFESNNALYDQNMQPISYSHDQILEQSQAHAVDQISVERYNENELKAQHHQEDPSYNDRNRNQSPVQLVRKSLEPDQTVQSGEPIQYKQSDSSYSQQNIGQRDLQPHQYQTSDQSAEYVQPYNLPVDFDQNKDHDQSQIHFDENAAAETLYDQSGLPIQYDQTDPIYNQQYVENIQPIQYDQDPQLAGYDQYGQPLLYDQHGQMVQPQYDEHGQIIPQYDENGQLIALYDQNGHQYVGDQYKTDQQQYDGNGQPIEQYAVNEQPVYDQNQQEYNYSSENQVGYDPNQYEQYQDDGEAGYYQEPEKGDVKEKEASEYEVKGDNNIENDCDKDDKSEKEEPKVEPIKQSDEVEKIEPKKPPTNVMDILDTDTENSKQNTSKISNDTDFDFS